MTSSPSRLGRAVACVAVVLAAILTGCSSDSDSATRGAAAVADQVLSEALAAGEAAISDGGLDVPTAKIASVTIAAASVAVDVADDGAGTPFFRLVTEARGGAEACLEGNAGAGEGGVVRGLTFVDACGYSGSQLWRFVEAGTGRYRLQTLQSVASGRCLAVPPTEALGAARMEPCGDSPGQVWRFADPDNGDYRLRTAASSQGVCLQGSPPALDGAAGMTTCDATAMAAPGVARFASYREGSGPGAVRVQLGPGQAQTPNWQIKPTSSTAAPTTPAASGCDAERDVTLAEVARQREEATAKDGIARPPFTWAANLACGVQEYARTLGRSGSFVHSTFPAAEGLARGPGESAADGVAQWRVGEMPFYDFTTSKQPGFIEKAHPCFVPRRGECGHYAGVVTNMWSQIACASAQVSARPGDPKRIVTVCRFGGPKLSPAPPPAPAPPATPPAPPATPPATTVPPATTAPPAATTVPPAAPTPTPPPSQTATPVSAGLFHTCAVTAAGAVRCWGRGDDGQLGSGAKDNLLDGPGESPSTVPLDEPATDVTAGDSHTCALTRSGAVRCWGSSFLGELGSGTRTRLLDGPGESPSTVPLDEPATQVSAGNAFTCALTRSGAVRCWGSGGSLGSGSYDNLLDGPGESPSTVPLGEPATQVSAGNGHACAVTRSGAVRCWGVGGNGRLGSGATTDLLGGPGQEASAVPLGAPAIQVSTGGQHTCALMRSGTVRCWGDGSSGQLGTGGTDSLLDEPGESPSTVPLDEPVTQISAGGSYTCALTQSGAVRCWGRGDAGRLGNGAPDNLLDEPGESPATVPPGEPATQVSAGTIHTCALTRSSAVRCWGAGDSGQLGSGAPDDLLDEPGESASTVPLS